MNDLLMKSMDEAIDIIKQSKNIFIASHINPDGDSIGSSLSLAQALKKLGKDVFVLINDTIPSEYLFLPGKDLLVEYRESLGPIDLMITVDSSDIDRLGENRKLLSKANYVINIDHHISNTKFGDLNIINSKSAATAELIYQLITIMSISLDEDIATNIYVAINTDTGSFRYESVTSDTHKIVAALIATGIDIKYININLYEKYSIERTKLFIKSLATLRFYSDSRLATVKVSQAMLEETNTDLSDSEGIVSFVRSIGSVEVACLLKELSNNEIKISMRSKEYVDVASICDTFNGGGHIRAAGCTIYDELDIAEDMIVKSIVKNLR